MQGCPVTGDNPACAPSPASITFVAQRGSAQSGRDATASVFLAPLRTFTKNLPTPLLAKSAVNGVEVLPTTRAVIGR